MTHNHVVVQGVSGISILMILGAGMCDCILLGIFAGVEHFANINRRFSSLSRLCSVHALAMLDRHLPQMNDVTI